MGEQRRVYLHGNSWVTPVPRVVRRHLGLLRGGDLYWHVGPKGEAFVTTGAHRIGGHPAGARLDRDLTAAHKSIERLERQLAARRAAVYNEGTNEGFMRGARALTLLGAQLDTVTARLADIEKVLAGLWYRRAPRAPRPAPSSSAPPAVACRVCGEPFEAHPKPDHAYDTLPVGAPSSTQ